MICVFEDQESTLLSRVCSESPFQKTAIRGG